MNENRESEYISEDSDAAESRIKKTKLALKQCHAEKQEYLGGWQRALADFQNYKKQQRAEKEEFAKFANASLFFKVLPVLDNLALISNAMPESERGSSWAKGILNVYRQFEGMLAEEGLEEIKINKGDKFNPEFHEAIEEVTGEGESGTVLDVAQKGYTLHGNVVRPSKVKVFK